MAYLHELDGRLGAAPGLPTTLDGVLSAAISLMGADLAMLWLLDAPDADGRTPTRPSPPASACPMASPTAPSWRGSPPSRPPPRLLAIEDVEAEPEASPWRVAGRAVGFRAVSVVPPGPAHTNILIQ